MPVYYDVTVPITERMPVWPGDPQVKVEWLARTDRGDALNLSRLSLSSHTGTHVDAPSHFVHQGLTVDRLPLDLFIGPAFVAEMAGLEGRAIRAEDLAALSLPQGTVRLLLKTGNSCFWQGRESSFRADYVHLTPEAARWLVEHGIRLIGVDYLSVEALDAADHRVHHTLLGAGVLVVEGLDLSEVPAGPCHLVCLPLKVEGGEGAPARVLVIRDQVEE